MGPYCILTGDVIQSLQRGHGDIVIEASIDRHILRLPNEQGTITVTGDSTTVQTDDENLRAVLRDSILSLITEL
eukprot:m.24723 g.24723  ORF g.24723 m.24723 type:complete len:74 (+) comp4322_c0_seq1:1834-2055(+)